MRVVNFFFQIHEVSHLVCRERCVFDLSVDSDGGRRCVQMMEEVRVSEYIVRALGVKEDVVLGWTVDIICFDSSMETLTVVDRCLGIRQTRTMIGIMTKSSTEVTYITFTFGWLGGMITSPPTASTTFTATSTSLSSTTLWRVVVRLGG
jgi:hypothetical protein